MKQLLPLICLLLATCMESVEAQQHIDLSGKWHFGTGAKATYDGFVSLPGSMQTNGKGEKMTALVGVLNVHWGEKGYAMASEWREFWVYPDIQEEQATQGLHIADTLDAKALEVLRNVGKVLVTAAGKVTLGNDVKQHYLPVFWNTSWFKMRPPHTTGAYIDCSHPLFRHAFPTDSWSNLNWWELLNNAQVMNLMALPSEYQSPVQPIDTWHVSRKLGMLIEAKVLNGTLLMTTMDIDTDLSHRIVARQMRHAILTYMQSEDFRPSLRLTPETITDFFTKRGPRVDMFTHDSPDELKPALKAGTSMGQ